MKTNEPKDELKITTFVSKYGVTYISFIFFSFSCIAFEDLFKFQRFKVHAQRQGKANKLKNSLYLALFRCALLHLKTFK